MKGMAYCAYGTRSLTVRFNSSIPGTCFFLDAKFRDMPRSAVSVHRGSNYPASCNHVIFNSCFVYSLLNCLTPSSVLFNFRFLIILPVLSITFCGMVFRKPIALMRMRSHHIVDIFYLSRMPLGEFGTMIGSTC